VPRAHSCSSTARSSVLHLTGGSRVDLLRAASPALADELEALLAAGGSFPTWGDEDLREEISDQRLRARVLAEVRPQPREFWTEALPAIPSWPDAPCGYLELSPHYGLDPADRLGVATRVRRTLRRLLHRRRQGEADR
jgi:hypothetical protein